MKDIYFLSGLPRSGTTLLANLLNQHPKIYCSPQSEMLNLTYKLRNMILESEALQLGLRVTHYQRLVNNLIHLHYEDIQKPTIIDKNFGWATAENQRMASNWIHSYRVIMPYRPLLEVFASFVALCEKDPNNFIDYEITNSEFYPKYYLSKNDARAEYLAQSPQITQALVGFHNGLQPENKEHFLFIKYKDIIYDTQNTFNKICDFLTVEPFTLDIKDGFEVYTYKDDKIQMKGLHDIRPTLSITSKQPEDLFSPYILEKYNNALVPFGLDY